MCSHFLIQWIIADQEAISPALAGGFFTTESPGKPLWKSQTYRYHSFSSINFTKWPILLPFLPPPILKQIPDIISIYLFLLQYVWRYNLWGFHILFLKGNSFLWIYFFSPPRWFSTAKRVLNKSNYMPLICLKIILRIWSWEKPNQNKSPLPQFKFKLYFPHLSMLDFVLTKVPLNPRHTISHTHIYTYYRNLSTLVTKTADFTIRIPMYQKTLFISYQKKLQCTCWQC